MPIVLTCDARTECCFPFINLIMGTPEQQTVIADSDHRQR